MVKKNLYEGMFLVDSAEAGADWDGVIAAIKRILERAKAEIVSIRKWDDRRLAYGIRGKARGTYILCYFRADGQKIRDIEKAVQLSEKFMRALILSTEQMTTEDIERDTPATRAEREKEKRKATKETVPKAGAEQLSAEQEAQTAEEAEQAEESEQDKQPEQAEEAEAEDLQESEPKTIADD